MATFYLIRHGDTDLVGKALAGRSNEVHLTARGRLQAERLAARLAREPIRQIYCSPIARARETAQPMADRLGLDVRIDEALNEIDFGDWSGLTLDRLEPNSQWRRYNTFRSGTRVPGGEMMLETQTRVVAFMQRLCDQFPDQTFALVSHGDVIRAAVLYYLGIPLDLFLRLEISPGSDTKVMIGDLAPLILHVNRTDP
jgi:probable phosphomutase (TIGR03848 family)